MNEPVCQTLEDGTLAWRLSDDRLHRTDGPAVTFPNGDQEWWVNGRLHRTDGPAVIYCDGYQAWFLNGHLHRTDGPAIVHVSGRQEWWIDGKQLTKQEFDLYRFRKWALDGELV